MNADPSSNSPAPTEQQTQPVQQQPSAPPRPTFITDPYGSGATFSWSGSTGVDHIPYVGDPDYVAYTQAVGNWLAQREAFYKTTVQYQKDQAASNPAIASGQIPGVGFTAEAPNAWGIPIGATVTELKPMNGGYQIGYQERGTPQQVTIEGPGYSMSGTVYAKDAQLAAKIALGSAYAQVGGVDVSPSKIGGYVASSGGNQAVVQVGDPARNEYWVSKGLPQYAGYSIPVLTSEQSVEGFYIKEVKANGASPQVITGNKQWESFWSAQGHPELGGYEAPKLESGQYVFNPSVNSQGQLSFGVGNTNWESQWKQLGVTDVNTIRGYAPPTDLATGSYIKNISKSNEGLNFTLGNTITEARLADINAKLDVINAQNKVFVDSYNTGAIKNPLDLQKALTRQNELTIGVLNQAESYGFLSAQDKQENINQLNLSMQSINNLANSYKPTATQTAVPAPLKVYSAFNPNISPLGVDPSNDIVRIAETNMGSSLLVRSDYKVAGKQESIVDGKTVVNYSIVPKISVASVDQAIAAHDLQSNFMQRSGGQQGTRTLGLSEAQYTQFLTPEQKTEYTNALNVRTQGRMIDLATMIASGVAAPSLGVGGAIKAVGISVGLAQAFKTGEYYFTGKEVTQSLLSPKEFVQSTTQGLLIGGVANKSIQVLKIAGSGLAPAIERTAVFGSVGVVSGGVSEFSQTGKVTAEGLAIGGVEGLAFGAVGEGLGGLKGKTQSYIRSSPTGQALQQKLNMSYLDAADAMKLYEPSLSDKIIMKTTGLRPTKPLNIVAAGTDVDIGLLNSGFVKPPESSLSAGERAIAEKALGIKSESMPKGYLEGFTKPPETSLTIEQEVTVRKALGSEANGKPMPPDYAKSFGLDSKATASPELSPDDIKISKMYRKATSDMPEDYVAGFGLESEWKAPAKHVKALPAKDQPNFVSQEFTDMVWNISSQPGSSSIAVERSMDTVGGSSKSNPVTPLNSGVGAVVLNKTVDVSLKEIVKDLTPVQAPKSTLDNGPALAPIKLDVKASSKSNSVPAIIQMDASPVAKENVDNPFAQSASPYPLIKKKSMGVISEDILVSYSVPSNSPLPKISEEQLLTSVPSSKQNIQSFQLITPISSALDSGERNRVGALPYNIPVQGSYPNTGLGSKDILKQVSDVSPIMGSDIRLDTVVVPSVSLASVVDVASIVDTVQTQKVRTELTQEYRLEFGTSIIPYEERVYRYPSFPKYSDNDNHRKRSKGIGDIFTFTAFRTTSAPKQTGVEKQVVRAKLVNFYPSTGRKVPDALKKQKGSNEYFRAVTIDGVHGIGEFQGTNQSVGFYPAGSSSGSGWNVPDKQRRKKR